MPDDQKKTESRRGKFGRNSSIQNFCLGFRSNDTEVNFLKPQKSLNDIKWLFKTFMESKNGNFILRHSINYRFVHSIRSIDYSDVH